MHVRCRTTGYIQLLCLAEKQVCCWTHKEKLPSLVTLRLSSCLSPSSGSKFAVKAGFNTHRLYLKLILQLLYVELFPYH